MAGSPPGSGDSQWIGGEESLRLAHRLRGNHDAVLVGVGTVVADNPRLTTRLVRAPSPRRVVLDPRLRLPLDAHVVRDGAAPTIIVTSELASAERCRAVAACGVEVLVAPADPAGRLDLPEVVQLLAQRGIRSMLVEGGAGVITSVLRAGLCDRLVVCIAPRLIGQGIEAVGDLGFDHLRQALTFSHASFSPIGGDVIFEGEIARSAALAG